MENKNTVQLINNKNLKVLSSRICMADTFFTRLKGLMFSKALTGNHCLWILKCKSVHSFFMQFALDLVFVDKNLVVVKIIKNLKPWRLSSFCIKASSVFEFNVGQVNNIKVGDQLLVQK